MTNIAAFIENCHRSNRTIPNPNDLRASKVRFWTLSQIHPERNISFNSEDQGSLSTVSAAQQVLMRSATPTNLTIICRTAKDPQEKASLVRRGCRERPLVLTLCIHLLLLTVNCLVIRTDVQRRLGSCAPLHPGWVHQSCVHSDLVKTRYREIEQGFTAEVIVERLGRADNWSRAGIRVLQDEN